MQTVTDLIDAARKALNVSSDAEFARQLGVSRGTIANWKSGYSLPDTVMCATLAGLTGLPLARVLGIVGEARAVSREEKAVWRKLAATAMALCLAVGFALPHKAHAAVSGFESTHAVYIMRNTVSGVILFEGSAWRARLPCHHSPKGVSYSKIQCQILGRSFQNSPRATARHG